MANSSKYSSRFVKHKKEWSLPNNIQNNLREIVIEDDDMNSQKNNYNYQTKTGSERSDGESVTSNRFSKMG